MPRRAPANYDKTQARRQAKRRALFNRSPRILGENGEWYAAQMVGPNQFQAKTWKTRNGAQKAAAATGRSDVQVTEARG